LSDKNKRSIYDMYGEDAVKGHPPPQSHGGEGGFPGSFPGGFPGGFHGGFPGGGGTTFHFSTGGFPGGGVDMQFDGMGDMADVLNDLLGQMFPGVSRRGSGRGGGRRGGGFGGPGDAQQTQSLKTIEQQLSVTLEELFTGTKKTINVEQQVMMGGAPHVLDKTFEVEVKPGWKQGTRIVFPPTRNFPFKVVFTIQQQKHRFLERRGDDLYWKCVPLSKKKLRKGLIIKIPNIDGSEISINTKNLSIKHNAKHAFPGLGMPISKAGGKKRGDFIVKFQVAAEES
jgi:DnaJ family protein B protein 4